MAEILRWFLLGLLLGGRSSSREPPWPPFPTTPPEPPGPQKPPPGEPPAGPPPKLTPLAGDGWAPYSPTPARVVARARELLGELKLGEVRYETDVTPDAAYQVAYRKEPHGGRKVGITVYRRKLPS